MKHTRLILITILITLSLFSIKACSNSITDENQNGTSCSSCSSCYGDRQCENGICCGVPKPQTECVSNQYQYDESITGNQCSNDCQCGGNRICSTSGWCQGTAVVENLSCQLDQLFDQNPICSGSVVDEAQPSDFSGQCSSCNECEGSRICVQNNCCGLPRKLSCCKNNGYEYDESATSNQCSNDCQCSGNRICSSSGWCHGTSQLLYLSCFEMEGYYYDELNHVVNQDMNVQSYECMDSTEQAYFNEAQKGFILQFVFITQIICLLYF